MSGDDASLKPISAVPFRNGYSHSEAYDGDLYSAIASSIAQGEASRQTAGSPRLSGEPAAAAVPQADSSHNATTNQRHANGATSVRTNPGTIPETSSSSYRSKQSMAASTLPVDRSEMRHRSSSAPGANSIQDRAQPSHYLPATGSESEQAAPLSPNDMNNAYTQAFDEMDRSPSVSYVDPGVDLAEEQDRRHMVDYYAHELPELTGSAAPLADMNDDRRTSRSLSLSKPTAWKAENTAVDSLMLQEAFEEAGMVGSKDMTPTPTSSSEKGKAREEAGTPGNQGWGISGPQTPRQSDTYNEQDELDELDYTSPQPSTPKASRSQPQNKTQYADTLGGSQTTPARSASKKGKERASEDDVDLVGPSPLSTRAEEDPPLYFLDDDVDTVPHLNKGKEQARNTTPSVRRRTTTPPTSARLTSQALNPRPAAIRRKYRGLERMKKAACLALNRSETYLDVALEDHGRTCWIRCVNWGHAPEDEAIGAEGDGKLDETVAIRSQAVASTNERNSTQTAAYVQTNGTSVQSQRHRERQNQQHQQTEGGVSSAVHSSSRLAQSRITCDAEVLAELVDGDAEQDKWRVIRMNGQHTTACEMIIKQMRANEILERENIDIQAEDDPELAEDILAASYDRAVGTDDDEDPELSQAIQASLDAARQQNGNSDHLDAGYTSPVGKGSGSEPLAGPSGTTPAFVASKTGTTGVSTESPGSGSVESGREVSPKPDSLPANFLSTSQASAAENSHGEPGLLRRIYETFSPRRAAPSPRCWTGDRFKSKDGFLDAAAAALSLERRHIFARVGARYGAPHIEVFCPCNQDLSIEERSTVQYLSLEPHDCTAYIKAHYKEDLAAWMVGNLQVKHSQHCRAVQMARTALTGGIASNAPNGQAQPSGLVPLHSDSTIKAQSKVEPGITKLMPFGNTVDLIRAASKALARDPSQLDVQESQHPVFSKQFICNIYCKNYAFGQTQTTARGWSAMVPRLGLGGGNQPSKCMAVVEAYKKSDDHPWQIASFKLEHNVRCQADYEQAQTSIPSTGASSSSILDNKDPTSLRPAPSINPARAAMIAAGTASTISNRHDNRPAQNPDEAVRAAYAVRAAQASSGSRSSSAASLPKRQPALRPAIPSMQQYVADSARAGSSDSDIEFVGETKTAPLIEVGESYKPNELGKLAQKLSTLVNKGSEVVWTQKPGNAPRSLACKYGPGFSQDTQAGIICTFRVSTKFYNGKLKVEHLCAEHSAACMRKYGNEPADIKPKLHPSTESLAARKTGRTVVGRTIPESSDEDQPTATRVNGRLSGRIKSPMPVDQSVASGMHAESSLAVQARQRVGQQRHSTSRSLKERPRGDASTPSTHRSKQIKAPPKPQDGRIYNSIHHFLNDVKAYSEAKSPAADLRKSDNHGTKSKGKGKAAKTLVMECGYPGCPFRIAAKSLQDAKGRDLEGFQVLSSVPKHSRECRHTERTKPKVRNSASKSASVIEFESSVQPDLKSDDEEHPGRRKRKGRASDAGLVQEGRKRPRIAESEESNHSLPPPLSVAASRRDAGHDAHFHPPRSAIGKDLEDPPAAEIDSPAQADGPLQDGVTFGLRSPTHSSEGGTPAPFVARQAAPKGEEDAEDFFAPYRNIVPVEPQSRERLPGQVKLYTGQIFDSRDEFVDAVLRHTEERNPGCRLAVANTDPARVRVYCMRADCPYSFNSVYEHGARRVPAVKVTANHRDHSANCLAYYKRVGQDEQRVHFDPPMVDQEIGDWNDFRSAVQAHTDSVNPGCELKTTKSAEHLRVYCPHKDLGCKYSFRAKFDIAEIQEGRVKVTNARTEHSDGCLEHHKRIAEENAEEEEALNRSVAKKSTKGEENKALPNAIATSDRQGPGPHPGDEFADETAFRAAVEAHTQLVNPGSSLVMRYPKNNRQIQCRNYHTGCRYEFYAALHPPAEDGTRRVIVTDVTPDHHEMCVAELVLQGRRPAPGGEEPIRTRRSRASLAGLAAVNGQGSQSSQAGTSINGTTKIVARKSTQSQKPLARSRLHDSDSDSDRPALRESNLLSHTSMSSFGHRSTVAESPVKSGRPPLIPPSQRVNGRPPLQSFDSAPARPLKRTRFEDVAASSSSSSHGPPPLGALPAASSSSTGDSSASNSAATEHVSASLLHVMQDRLEAANLLARMGYHTVADLMRVGVSVEDWPDLFQFLGGCDVEGLPETPSGQLDPLERFLLHRRARLAFADEALGQFRHLSKE